MKSDDILDLLNDIDADLINEANDEVSLNKKSKKTYFLRYFLPAAVFTVVLGVTAFAMGYNNGAKSVSTDQNVVIREDEDKDSGKSGYYAELQMNTVDASEVNGEINTIKPQILINYANSSYFNSVMPGYYSKDFESREAAREFVGYDGLVVPYFPYDESQTNVKALCDSNGDLLHTQIETNNFSMPVRVQVTSVIYTSNSGSQNITVHNQWAENVEFNTYSFNAKNGLECTVVETTPLKSGYKGETGYVILDNVLYTIHTAYNGDLRSEALEIIHDWAEAFPKG